MVHKPEEVCIRRNKDVRINKMRLQLKVPTQGVSNLTSRLP
jgi:hypothetical protein